jgi:tRNA pseudouridine(38-40) synthase
MTNYKLLIQYDGTDFHGWQVQENDRTIQGELERVIGYARGCKGRRASDPDAPMPVCTPKVKSRT